MASAREKLEAVCGPVPVRLGWLGIGHVAVARIAAASGVPAALVDREHGAIGVETAAEMVAALKGRGLGAFVRVPDHAKAGIQQALDAGADGVLVPQVESAEAAAAAVARALYPPLGTRGAAAGVIQATRYGADRGYQPGWNARAIVAVQVESRAALAAAPDIAAVDGVDMLFFGPFDYASEAGLSPEVDGSALAKAFAELRDAAAGAGKLTGAFPWPGEDPAGLARRGVDLVAVASDVAVLAAGLRGAAT